MCVVRASRVPAPVDRMFDPEPPAHERSAIQFAQRPLGILGTGHFHKTKPARAALLEAVTHDFGTLHRPKFSKGIAQRVVRQFEIEISDK